jgi:CheY-like chemotaxis protein
VAEDDGSLRALVKFVLERAGHVVHTATDGVDAVGKVDAFDPDLVISDHEMPRVNGTELHELLAQGSGPHPPMLLLTAFEDSAPVLALRTKVAGTLFKPFRPTALLALVDQTLGAGHGDTAPRCAPA